MNPKSKTRRGVSLLEVLISIFVLSIGLLGVAAMIPVGRFEIVEAAKADRSAVLGRLAMREVKIRRMLEPQPWSLDNTPQVLTMWQGVGIFSEAQYVMIDPLYVTKNGVGNFPATGGINMPRINLWAGLYQSSGALTRPAAEEIFVSRDDLVFDIPKDRDLRPVRMPSGNRQQYLGNYSWAAMVASDAAEAAAELDATSRSRMTVSIVVFYKRNLDPNEAERTATVTWLGGADWTLSAAREDLERVKRNHWILLCGRTGGPPAPRPLTTAPLFQWYRVVAVAAGASDTQRDVTLAGPDWTGPTNGLQAVLIDGVVGVYTETVETNRNLLREAKPN